MSGLDSEQIRHAILTAQTKGYRQVRVRLGEDRFSAVLAPAPVAEPDEEADSEAGPSVPVSQPELVVGSPAVGYFRAIEPMPQVGDKVEPGVKVGEVVALGLANDVTAKEPGEVVDVCVVDGDAVEFGQSILRLRR